MAVVGIVPAGGSGERLGADRPKAFVVCAGRPLIEWSLEALGSVCDRIVVAAPPGYDEGADRVKGGESRSASVRNAVAAAEEADIFVVHDAARPLVTRDLVQRCLDAIEPGVDGAIAAIPMTDTVKEVAPDCSGAADARPVDGCGRCRRPRCSGRDIAAARARASTRRRSPPPPTMPRWWTTRAA